MAKQTNKAQGTGDSKPSMGGGRLWGMRLAAMVLVPVLFLATVEGMLRVAGIGYRTDYWKPSTVGERTYLVPNFYFTYRFFPPHLARAPLAQRIFPDKPEGSYRIFLFGGSAAYGDPDPAYGMGRHLEVLLRERFPGTEFEVVCTAMTAINSHAVLPAAKDCAELGGDLWIVYMGNNEMVGAFGAGTTLTEQAPSLGTVRSALALKTTRLGQLLDRVVGLGREGEETTEDWEGIDMFRKDLRFGDPARETVYANFRRNLEDLIAVAERAKVPVALSTVATNLRDCAPFHSLHAEGLTEAERRRWKDLFTRGLALQEKGEPGAAMQLLKQAAAIDPDYAEVHFRLGRCHLALGEEAAALRAFRKARDHDGLAVRADSRINAILRELGERYAAESDAVVLLDAIPWLAEALASPIPGKEAFYEHVHLTLAANYELARMFAEEVERRLPGAIAASDRGTWPSPAVCRRELALTKWDLYRLWNNMGKRLQEAPHTRQSNNEASLAHIEERKEAVVARIDDTTPRADTRLYERALEKFPQDNLLHARFGQYLEAMGRREQAIARFRTVSELLPDLALPRFYTGNLLMRAGRTREARKAFREALEIRPDCREARAGLAELRD